MTLTRKQRVAARNRVGLHHNSRVPFRVVEGDHPPTMVGMRGHYRTRGGRIIDHPSAYSKKGWGNMIYHGSTAEIVVGAEWKGE